MFDRLSATGHDVRHIGRLARVSEEEAQQAFTFRMFSMTPLRGSVLQSSEACWYFRCFLVFSGVA
jgi:hypothetical protein